MENIIERITKLLALSTSPFEHEAQAAAAKAQELLMLHNLKLCDITGASTPGAILTQKIDDSSRRVFWKISLAQDIAATNFCSVWRHRKQLVVAGREDNIATVKVLYDYLVHTVERLGTESVNTQKQLYQTYLKQITGTGINPQREPSWRIWRNSFITGCSNRLRERLWEQKLLLERSGIPATDTSSAVTALACRSAYERETAAIEQWTKAQGMNIVMDHASSQGRFTKSGYRAGIKAGNQISLNHQLSNATHSAKP